MAWQYVHILHKHHPWSFVAHGSVERTLHSLGKYCVAPAAAAALSQAVIPIMAAQGSGKIINIGSLTGFTPVPFRGIYSASKAAVMRLSDALRLECRPLGIQVLLVAPGFIATNARSTAKVRLRHWVMLRMDQPIWFKRFLQKLSACCSTPVTWRLSALPDSCTAV